MRYSIALLLIVSSLPLQAWNKAGHMVTASIAHDDLRERHPVVTTRVASLLRRHPDFAHRWQSKLAQLPASEHELFLFMAAARWPDDIRGTSHDRDKWHYINYPYRPASQPSSVTPIPPDSDNVLRAFDHNLKLLRRTNTAAGERAIALCWLFHLMGDIHQPLHTVALFTTEFPKGDRGGTLFFVKVSDNDDTLSLHKLWDGLLLRTQNFSSVRNRATRLRLDDRFKRATLPELTNQEFRSWARDESFRSAVTVAYRHGRLPASRDDEDGELLPPGYLDEALAVAERRAVLAGYRLADLLVSAFQH